MSIDTNYELLRRVIKDHQPEGWAAEFGVYSGFSLGIIAQHMPVIGFDSFKGLPEDWREGFGAGAFTRQGELKKGIPLDVTGPNRMVIPGWFEDTVPDFPFPSLGLVHVDCDLYSSTVTVLDAVRPFLMFGSLIIFDEFHGYDGWENHEYKAWMEFLDQNPDLLFEEIGTGPEEIAFKLVGGRFQ